MNMVDAKRVLEAALLCAQQPMPLKNMRELFAESVGVDTVKQMLDDLRSDWAGRGMELVCVASGWRFQSRPDMREYLDRLHPEKPPKYTRATLETLAIIAYKQPVTRLDVEKIRGVNCDHAINRLVEYNLVEELGRLDAPGRPLLFGTTEQFLRSFGVGSLEELPELSAVQVEEFKEQAEQEAVLQLQT